MSIADVYDALVSKRIYKPAFSHEKAIEIMLEGKEKHFEPLLIDILLEKQEAFRLVADTYKD